MKKNYLFLAAAATMFTACVQSDLVSEIPEAAPQAISFETFANKQTRADATAENSSAAYTENSLYDHHVSFYVWASKEVVTSNTGYTIVYDKGVVNGTANDKWTPTSLKYWDKTATSYEFYAAAPTLSNNSNTYGWDWTEIAKTTAGTTAGTTGGYLTFNNYVLTGASTDNLASVTSNNDSWKDLTNANDIDLMIAAPCKVTTYTNPVNLDFIHILSRLNINVKTAETTTGTTAPDIKLTGLEVHGLKNKGTFNENTTLPSGTTLSSGTHLRWENTSQGSVSPSYNGNTYTLAAHLGTGTELLLTDKAVATHTYLIIPQLVSNIDAYANKGTAPTTDAYIKINYTVDGEAFEAYYSLAKAFGVAQNSTLAFNEGWQNTLNITIAPDVITFTADAAVWVDKFTNNEPID